MKVAILLSGGVDSSYAAYLLQQEGHEVVGIYLKLHNDETKHAQNLANIEKVATHLGIVTHTFDARELFKKSVYDYFVDSYAKGFTPNPCAFCNPLMKFGYALERARELGCEKVATGHYARVNKGRIQEARDSSKDQSYFLFGIEESTIPHLLFPLGDRLKSEIKPEALAILPWLGTLESYKDSQEICFVDKDYIEVLERHFPTLQEGVVYDAQGKAVGAHKGYMRYTIGKRKGFTVRGAHEPHYVMEIDPARNAIVVGSKEDLARNRIIVEPFALPQDFKNRTFEGSAKVRYRSAKVPARAWLDETGRLIVELGEKVYGVAKGQALVLYEGDLVLGGGWIVDSSLES